MRKVVTNTFLGSLTDSVRNYVLGSTAQVFLQAYQARHVAADLVRVAFEEELSGNNDELFLNLKDSFLRRDADVPAYPTTEFLKSLEGRQDIRNLRDQYEALVPTLSADHPECRHISRRIFYVISTLSKIKVDEMREHYFAETDRLRSAGLPVPKSSVGRIDPFRRFELTGSAAASAIGVFMQQNTLDMQPQSELLCRLYVAFLQRQQAVVQTLLSQHGEVNDGSSCTPESKPEAQECRPHRCLFGCGSFRQRGNLTKHNTKTHFNLGQFDRPFDCPECLHANGSSYAIDGPLHWSNHITQVHGAMNAPSLPSGLLSRPSSSWIKRSHADMSGNQGPCLICGDILESGGAFKRHFRQIHLSKEALFTTPFECPPCVRQGIFDQIIMNEIEWKHHVESVHQGGGIYGRLHTTNVDRPTRADTKHSCSEERSGPAKKRRMHCREAEEEQDVPVCGTSQGVTEMAATTDENVYIDPRILNDNFVD